MQLFKFSASKHQQDRGILLETKAKAPRFEALAEAVKIAHQGCLEARQCLEAAHHCLNYLKVITAMQLSIRVACRLALLQDM